jgi:hypothetical protein
MALVLIIEITRLDFLGHNSPLFVNLMDTERVSHMRGRHPRQSGTLVTSDEQLRLVQHVIA